MNFLMSTEQPSFLEYETYDEYNQNPEYSNFDESYSYNDSDLYNGSYSCPDKSAMKSVEYNYNHYVLMVSLPIIILVGIIGNILSIVVLRRRVMQMSAASFYLIILAFSDLSILLFSALKTWVKIMFEIEMLHMSNAACKILKYIFFTSAQVSSWLVVAITVERLVVVRFPFKASRYCSYHQSVRITCVICAVIFLLNLNVLWAQKLVVYNCMPSCVTFKFSSYVYTAYNLSIYSLIPFGLVLSMNLMTVLTIIKNNKLFKQQPQTQRAMTHTQISSISKANRQANQPDIIPPNQPSTGTHSSKESGAGSGAKNSTTKDTPAPITTVTTKHCSAQIRSGPRHLVQQQRRLTCTLLTITILWLLLTAPYIIIDMLALNDQDPPFLLRIVTYLLMYTNHAINFYIYCLTGRKFRTELKRVFCSKRKTPVYQKVLFKQSAPLPPIPLRVAKPQSSVPRTNGSLPTGGEAQVERTPASVDQPQASGSSVHAGDNGYNKQTTTKL